mgnify:FL=1
MRAQEDSLSSEEQEQYLRELDEAEKTGDVSALREILKQAVSGFTPEREISDIVYKQQN